MVGIGRAETIIIMLLLWGLASLVAVGLVALVVLLVKNVAGKERCPYCGVRAPGAGWRRLFGGAGGGFSAETAYTWLLYLNVGMYVLSLVLSPRQIGMVPNPFRFLSPSGQSLFLLGSTGTVPIDHAGRWWTLITANYLHGGILHIFFNMAALRQLAPLVLREFGLNRAGAIYTLGGVGWFLVSYLAGVPRTIGASAALCALIGAALYYGKNRGGVYGQAVFRTVWGWALSIMVFGFLSINMTAGSYHNHPIKISK